jgi:hypothetical protein
MRPSRILPLGPERVVALTQRDRFYEVTHWMVVMIAEAMGIGESAVRRVWRAHGLAPHSYRQFKLTNDPNFVVTLRDSASIYADPPGLSIVLSFGKKSQIETLNQTQPGLPMKKGRLGTMPLDDKRNGTITLFAALNTLYSTVIGRNRCGVTGIRSAPAS